MPDPNQVPDVLPIASLALLAGISIWICYTDLASLYVNDWASLALLLTGAAYQVGASSSSSAAADAMIGLLLFPTGMIALRWLFLKFRGVEALGLGDIKLSAGIGLWIGASGIPVLLLVASLATLVAGLSIRLLSAPSLDLWRVRMPFAPGLLIALWIVLLCCSA